MKKWVKTAFCIVLSFMVCFMTIGYAQLSDTLSITGSATVEVPDGLFIIDMQVDGSASGLSTNNYSFLEYTTTVSSSLKKSGRNAGTVTYEITVLNNTTRTYAYRGLYYQASLDGYDGNSYISERATNNTIAITTDFPNGKIVEPGETLVFYATYKVGSSLNRNTTWNTLVNYQFGINVDSVEEARSAVLSKFEDILNTPSTYATLYDKIDDKFSGAEWTSNYIGNVTDSSSTDSMTVNTLFAGHLQMVINGEENPITVLIKHENIDGNTQTGDDYTATNGSASFTGYGCEFTLYMTTSDLSDRSVSPPVYAAAFTCDRNEDGSYGSWYMIGESYEGTAQIVGYEGGESTGSFDTGTWRSVEATYSPIDDYSYTVSSGQTIQEIVRAVDPEAIAHLESLLGDAKKILDDNIYAGSGMEVLESIYSAYSGAGDLFTVADDGTITVDPTATRAKIVPHIQEISVALSAFENVL
ncbi:MAG: hypothetical protein IJ489_11065 [Clostridia bacterium]|nr:hypothetical protein [Clostridia bacterium]